MTPYDPDENLIKQTLPNGLTVLFKEDRSNPVVAINVWFGVGSVNETEEANGLAHFQEHMVFKGTNKRGVGEIANLVRSAGGNLNAATSYSYTMYYIVLPSRAFSLGLEVQADAMMNSTFDPDEFRKERLVVIDEARMYDDTPDSYTFYRTMELGYKVHNYRRPIAGYENIVREFTRDQLVEFYNHYYRPGNATLVIVGDIDPGTAMTEIEKTYGVWGNGKVGVFQSPAEPPQSELRFKALRGSIDHGYLGVGFHVPSILDPDYPALEMLSTLLGSGKSSRLFRKVVEEKHLATTASAQLLAEKWPGFFMVFASSPAPKSAETRDAVFEELIRFQREPVSEEELLKARRQVEKWTYSELETVEGQASELGYYQVMGDYKMAEKHRRAIRTVTPEEVMAVAKKYFKPGNCSVVSYLPDNKDVPEPAPADIEASFERASEPVVAAAARASGRPAKGSARSKAPAGTVVAANVELLRLDNGVRVLVKPRATVPMVSMLTVLQGGTRLEPAGKSGLSSLTTRALMKGTESYSAEAIVGTIEGLGGSIDCFSSFDVIGASTNILSEYLDQAVPVYKEVVRRPAFARDDVEHAKSKLLKELAKRHDHPVYLSIDALFANTFGDHPYGHPFIGLESDLAKLTDSDCRAWHERMVTPGNIVMAFVGDITPDRAREIAETVYGDLATGAVPEPEAKAPETAVRPGLHELKRPNLRQAVGLVGFTAPPMLTDAAIRLGVLNGVLTGLGGRLFVELRDKRSLGYMAGSTFMPLKDRSIFYAYSNPGPDGIEEAIEVILTELGRVAREAVDRIELERSKEWLIGSQTIRQQRNMSQAMEYGVHEALGFGYEFVDKAPGIIQQVTKESIVEAAAGVFDKSKAVFVKLVPELEEEVARE